ncbi:MAG: molybdenum cofactor guanylyltransferase MobA [Devosia sp.]
MIIVGVILGGGQSRRMGGGDKFLREIGGKRMLDHTLARLRPQVDRLILSANGNRQTLSGYGLPIVEDGPYAGYGPLAGVLAALHWAEATLGSDTVVVSVPADTPFIPLDLAARLIEALHPNTNAAIAASHGQDHHAVAAWPVSVSGLMEDWLRRGESTAVKDFLHSGRTKTVDFTATSHDPFFNVNTLDELRQAQAMSATCPDA